MLKLTKLQLACAAALAIFGAGIASAFNTSMYATTSQLASGKWVKIAIPENGMYELTYDEQKEQHLQSLEAAVAQLPEADRQIIQWHYYEDIPLQTIAQRLGQTENNIKVRMYRIRERIKKQMQL